MEATTPVEKPDKGIWRYDPSIPGGKYLVLRRDGSVFSEPSFVLGPRDPATPATLRAYADECERLGTGNPQYIADIRRMAGEIAELIEAGDIGDPGKGPHRVDHPLVIEQMLNPTKQILAPAIAKS